ncbi:MULTISPECIES: SpoIIE family protein phosphatase [unclassified Isoptericola]|uniref:SpoIIE family protein phosphatase n=1 Tax=unclassified Isoptericola TaxID=2623355 RepID=UPI002712B6AC|nr:MULTISPECIES: SpoIIE family protein phosphatase [unclassified Isoptericola]MDO8143774.1 SpoIIE family protein phosphatase [Isoptericola sp. 178]MDO8150025.1 SpoIIE family protein phosphatase [Isoptericola sp. b408]
MTQQQSAPTDITTLARDLLPEVHDPAKVVTGGAVLLVDTRTHEVVDTNPVGARMVGGLELPTSLGAWCAAAGLSVRDADISAERALAAAVDGSSGVAVLSARQNAPDDLWAVGVPLAGAPGTLANRALVVMLPGTGLQESHPPSEFDGLQRRAAVASHLSFTISDPSLPDDPLIWVNPAFCEVTGYTTDDVLGTNCRFLQGEGTDRQTVARIRAALDAGQAVGETLLNYRKDGTPFWNQVVVSPIHDDEGNVTHHVGIQTDVTERVHHDRRQALELDAANRQTESLRRLASITQALVDLFDEESGAAALPALVAPHYGSWCAVLLVDEHGAPRIVHGASRDPERADDIAVLERSHRWIRESPTVLRVLTTGTEEISEPFPVDIESLPARTGPEELDALRRLGLGSAMVVPLRGRAGDIGVLIVVSDDGDVATAFPSSDVHDIVALGARAGLALDNARLYRREQQTALTLQHSMLPEIVEAPGLDCAALYEPASAGADVGGDWYDVVPLPDGRVAISVGDVVGHDIRAAASMGQLRSVLRSEAWAGLSPSAVIAGVDDLVRSLQMADMTTCVFAIVDPPDDGGNRRITYTRAGHHAPLLIHSHHDVEKLDEALTTPIGAPLLTGEVPEASTVLHPGDSLVLFTDGLIERRDRPLRTQLENLLTCVEEVDPDLEAEASRDAIVEACADGTQEDDTCILVVRNIPVPSSGEADTEIVGPHENRTGSRRGSGQSCRAAHQD